MHVLFENLLRTLLRSWPPCVHPIWKPQSWPRLSRIFADFMWGKLFYSQILRRGCSQREFQVTNFFSCNAIFLFCKPVGTYLSMLHAVNYQRKFLRVRRGCQASRERGWPPGNSGELPGKSGKLPGNPWIVVKFLPGKSPKNFRGSLGLFRSLGEPDTLPATRQSCLQN